MTKAKESSTIASQRVADVIAGRILTGQLAPGERIKQEDLAAELEVSRIPVRDALRMLETRGLVTLQPNVGARVASLSMRDMELSYRIREQLEPMLLAESIPNLTDDDIARLAAIRAELEAADEVDRYIGLSREFHWQAFSRHDAPLLAQIVERLWDSTQSYRRLYAQLTLRDESRRQVMRAERDLLFGAIARRETELAAMTLRLHISRTQLSLRRFHGEAG